MLIKVSEKCLIDTEDGKESYGLREYIYESNLTTFLEAINDIEKNFDSDNIISNEDYFEEGCLDSEVIGYELLEV